MRTGYLLTAFILLTASAACAQETTGAPRPTCDQRIEKALRIYDAYERQDDDTVRIPLDDWTCMRRQMQRMHMRKDHSDTPGGVTRDAAPPGPMPRHGHFND